MYSDDKNAATLNGMVGRKKSLTGCIRAHLGRLQAGDYFGLVAYVAMGEEPERRLQAIRHAVAGKILSAMREKFGGHVERSSGG